MAERGLIYFGMWDLPGPGLEPVSPALAGRFLTTAPPGKSLNLFHRKHIRPPNILHREIYFIKLWFCIIVFFSLLERLEHPLITSSSFFSKHANTFITAVHDSFFAIRKDASGKYLREDFYYLNLCLKKK